MQGGWEMHSSKECWFNQLCVDWSVVKREEKNTEPKLIFVLNKFCSDWWTGEKNGTEISRTCWHIHLKSKYLICWLICYQYTNIGFFIFFTALVELFLCTSPHTDRLSVAHVDSDYLGTVLNANKVICIGVVICIIMSEWNRSKLQYWLHTALWRTLSLVSCISKDTSLIDLRTCSVAGKIVAVGKWIYFK